MSEAPTELEAQTTLDAIAQLGTSLAFNRHMGVEVREATIGRATVALPVNPDLDNHLGGVHAVAELAPVELAGALAAASRAMPLLARGYVPVVGGLTTRFRAPAHGELLATAELGPEALAPAVAAADAGQRPRMRVAVTVTDPTDTVVNQTEVDFVFVPAVPAATG